MWLAVTFPSWLEHFGGYNDICISWKTLDMQLVISHYSDQDKLIHITCRETPITVAARSSDNQPTFQRDMSPPFSGLKNMPRQVPLWKLCLPPDFTLISFLDYFPILETEAICFFETLVDFQQTKTRYIPQNRTLHSDGILGVDFCLKTQSVYFWEILLSATKPHNIVTKKTKRLPTPAARVLTQVWSCGILWWTKVALEQVFSENFGFPCQSTFHLLLHNHLHYHPRLAQ
jgi:hypothetical protein